MLVDTAGDPVREVEELERKIITELSKRVREKKRGQEWSDGTKTIRVTLTEDKPGVLKLKTTIDGNEIEHGRTILKRKYFEKYGECQLRKPSGHFHASIHDPSKEKVGNGKEPIDRRGGARTIAGGKVRDFGKSKIEETFGGAFANVDAKTTGSRPQAGKKKNAPVSPDGCKCQSWAKTTGSVDGEHHPICEFRPAWEKEHGRKSEANPIDSNTREVSEVVEAKVLVDLNTRNALREATPEEISLSGDTGLLQVGSVTYGLVPKSEVAPA
jgi:hypothetical protein